MIYKEAGDGNLKKCLSPIRGVPFYGDWLVALLARRAAFETPSLKREIDAETGLPKRDIIPYDRHQEQAVEILEDGGVRIICIGCAGHVEPMMTGFQAKLGSVSVKRGVTKGQSSLSHFDAQAGLSRIRVGGLVQFALDEPINERHNGRLVTVVQRWRRKSVSKMGYGCPHCSELYAEEVRRVSAENESKQVLYNVMKTVYAHREQWDKLAELREPKLYQPWIDILGGVVEAQQLTDGQERRL